MTNKDALRNVDYTIPASSAIEPLPLSEHARTRHLSIQDIDGLMELIAEHPNRLEKLIRQPFEAERDETVNTTTMRMPPFMRNSNAYPLTLSVWQYELLMEWVSAVTTTKALAAVVAMRRMSKDAADRRTAVLARLDRARRR